MGLVNNMVACYILGFVLITHCALILCVHQQIELSNPSPIGGSMIQPVDNPTYNCPQIPEAIIQFSRGWLAIVPQFIFNLFTDVFKLAGVEIVNILIWIGTIALIGDTILVAYYTLVKPLEILRSAIGIAIRLAVLGFIGVLGIYILGEEGIIPKQAFLEKLDFLQLSNSYKILLSSSQFFSKKIKDMIKKLL